MMRNSASLILYGVESSYAADVLESMERAGVRLAGSVITGKPEWDLEGAGSCSKSIGDELRSIDCLIPWVTPGWRKQRVDAAIEAGLQLAEVLIDPTAITPRLLSVMHGSYINAGAVIGAQCRFGLAVMIGRSASIGHHSILDDYVSIGPGATLASKVVVKIGTLIGAGASVAPDVTIGANCIIASGASVYRDVPDNVVAAGNPARIVKTDIVGMHGVGI